MNQTELALPKGSLVLVTGANGFVASHVIEQLLLHGYRVRGTVRAPEKLDTLKRRWDDKFPDQFEYAVVEDICVDHAFDEAMKGCDGVAHVASNVSNSPNSFDEVIRDAVEGTLNALRGAAATPTVKRVVLTSSFIAVGFPGGEEKRGRKLGHEDFNVEVVEIAKSLPDDSPMKVDLNYFSSKVQAEMAAWKFVQENEPSFTLNTICSSWCLGEIFDPSRQTTSTPGMTRAIFLAKPGDPLPPVKSIEYVPVRDTALLHVGALILPGVANKRLISSAYADDWTRALSIFRKRFPNREFCGDPAQADFPSTESSYDVQESLEVSKSMGKENGWDPLEEALVQTVAPFA
ncbi:hypothetical protein JCM16303_004313 [Sporobolomyces ruberrimus]